MRLLSIVVAIVLGNALIAPACSWRDGAPYLISAPDADSASCDADLCLDADPDHTPCDAGACEDADVECASRAPGWIDPGELFALVSAADPTLIIVDVRPIERCDAGRIPTARCIPWDGERLVASLDAADVEGWLVLYHENDSIVEEAAATVGPFCHRTVVMLHGGFGAWQAGGFEVELE